MVLLTPKTAAAALCVYACACAPVCLVGLVGLTIELPPPVPLPARSIAYSRISLADVAAKLALPSVEDTECVVAKAIRDGGVDAVLDHEAGAMMSREAEVRP